MNTQGVDPRFRQERREIPESFNIAVLVSPTSSASNLRAILEASSDSDFHGRVGVVIADRDTAPGLQIARESDIRDIAIPYNRPPDMKVSDYRDVYSAQVGQVLSALETDVAVLAGFNRILSKLYFDNYQGTTINIHPGAIPDKENEPFYFPDGTEAPWNQGLMTEDAVRNFLPLKYATSTLHSITERADFGPVLKRVFAEVREDDSVDSLYGRLKLEEHIGLIEVLKNPPLFR